MHRDEERGVALVLALFLMSAMSVLAASLMFLSQTETYASMNYRMMSQARYAAESGVQRASNFLLDSAQYQVPGTAGAAAEPTLANYDVKSSPVLYNNKAVTLSAVKVADSNYPVDAVKTAFYNAARGSLSAGTGTITYNSVAKLISMQSFDTYGGGTAVVQTWEITGSGTLSGARNATVEVAAIVETPKVPANSYAVFATDNTCGALDFAGNIDIDSYDSSTMTAASGAPTTDSSGGNVGTNGNLTFAGTKAKVHGNLYTPRTGVGKCTGSGVPACSPKSGGTCDVTGSIVQLPGNASYATPTIPNPSTVAEQHITTTVNACTNLGLTAANCTTSGNDIIINGAGTTLSLPSVSLASSINIVLVAWGAGSQYNFNSITLAGGSSISIKATATTQSVLVNVVGKTDTGTVIANPIDFTGGTFAGVNSCASCPTVASISKFDASMLQFIYGGSGTLGVTGNAAAAATFYAPNANVEFSGTADLYGSILSRRMTNIGTGNIHYDRRLMRDFYLVGSPLASSFSWKKS